MDSKQKKDLLHEPRKNVRGFGLAAGFGVVLYEIL